jgi:hypothetical protein
MYDEPKQKGDPKMNAKKAAGAIELLSLKKLALATIRLMPTLLRTMAAISFITTVPAKAAQAQFGLFRASLNCVGGYESNTLKLPTPELGEPTIAGYAYAAGVSAEPVSWGPMSLVLGSAFTGFLLRAKLEQSQFGTIEEGKFQADMLAIEGLIGIKYRLPVSVVPVYIGADGFYQRSLSGSFAAKVGFVDFDEKITNLSRIGGSFGIGYSPTPRVSIWLKSVLNFGTMQTQGANGTSVLTAVGSSGAAKLNGFGAFLGASCHFFVPQASSPVATQQPKQSAPEKKTGRRRVISP